MKPKNLAALIVVAALAIGLAVITSKRNTQPAPDAIGRAVLPDLQVNDVAVLAVVAAEETATITRTETGWVVPAKYNYPADFEKVRSTLLALADLKVGQVVTLDDALRSRLKLSATAVDGAGTGTLLELRGQDGETLASLIMGENRMRSTPSGRGGPDGYPDGRYVSADGGKTGYLVSEDLSDLAGDQKDWLDAEITSVAAADMAEITLTAPDGAALTLRRENGSLTLDALAEDEELDNSKLYAVESALNYLRLEDIADPSLEDAQLGFDKPSRFTVKTPKGEIYSVSIGGSPEGGDTRYIRVAVSLAPAQETADDPNDPAAGDENAKKERAELEAATLDLNARLSPWTYVISSYKADAMTRTRADLVKKTEEPEASTEPEAEPQESPAPTEEAEPTEAVLDTVKPIAEAETVEAIEPGTIQPAKAAPQTAGAAE